MYLLSLANIPSEPSAAPLCVITNLPARYRDPQTGLPYASAYAFREIQRLRHGHFKWSRLLGAWVGTGTQAARGVPERFLNPGKPNEKKEGVAAATGDGEMDGVKTEEDQTAVKLPEAAAA